MIAAVILGTLLECAILITDDGVSCRCETDTPTPPVCAHDECEIGEALEAGCNPCVALICACDAYCCASGWDSICVVEAQAICNVPCAVSGECQVCECPPE